jgi:hypothetical protein
MDTYKAKVYQENYIELEDSSELDKLYQTIEGEDNFILQWVDKDVLHSEVIIATHISSKVKNGEMLLKATEKNKE